MIPSIARLLKQKAFLLAVCCGALLAAFSNVVTPQNVGRGKDAGATLEGNVCDPSGAGVPGASLRLVREDGGSAAASSVEVKSSADGFYKLSVPGPGRYTLEVTSPGFLKKAVRNLVLGADAKRHLDLVLQTGMGNLASAQPVDEETVQFSDKPNFTVAGITDRSNMGLHGSDANVRTSDSLAKETAALKSSPGAKEAATPGVGDAHRLAGDAKEKRGDPVGAVNEYEAAVKLEPSEENYFAWGAELLLHRAGPAAVQVFAKGAEAYPKSSRMHAGLGAAYYADGQYNEAAGEICKASDLSPGDAQPYRYLGKMEKAAAELLPCSEERLARFANEQPGDALAHYYYALVLWKKARKAQDAAGVAAAEEHLRRAAELDPTLGEARVQLGLMYNERGQKDAALAEFQKAVAASPRLSEARYQLSLAYRRAGDGAKADQEMKSYEELRRSEDAQLEQERRELRQFVTILKDNPSPAPH